MATTLASLTGPAHALPEIRQAARRLMNASTDFFMIDLILYNTRIEDCTPNSIKRLNGH